MKQMFLTAIAAAVVLSGSAKEPLRGDNMISNSANAFAGKKKQMLFMENKGQITDQHNQARADLQFIVSGTAGLSVFIGEAAMHYQFSKVATVNSQVEPMNKFPTEAPQSIAYDMYRMDVKLIGANKHAQVVKEGMGAYYETHVYGGKTSNIHGYSKVTYKNIYPHIDWALHVGGNKLKHEFIVHEGGNIADIKLQYGGVTSLKVNSDGSLTANTPQGKITEQPPVSYQSDGKPVGSAYVLNGNVLTYSTDTYTGALTIDPTLEWATYFGDVSTDATFQMAKDGNSNLIAVGVTYSSANIATTGAYQTTYSGSSDGVIVKYNSDGQLQWCTYFATAQYDGVYNVVIDAINNIYVTGGAGAGGLATSGAQQTTYGGGLYDMFLAKFTSSGALTWCTYLGGSGSDIGAALALDGSGNIYLAGYSSSSSGLASGSVHQTAYGGGISTGDGILAKYNSSGAKQWCTYYGGTSDDQALSLAIGNSGDIYIAGPTASTSGIASSGAFQTAFGGLNDGYFAKFSSSGSRIWGSYLGGPNADRANSICVDASENVYVAGSFASDGFATAGTHQTVRAGSIDAFISKWTSGGVKTWFTYYGGTFQDVANGIFADNSGVYVAGQVSGAAIGVTSADAYQASSAGGTDAFIAKFNKDAGSLIYGSYYGGTGTDMGYCVIPDGGDLYFVGYTFSPGMATPGAAKETYTGGQQKGWVAKFNFCTPPTVNVTGVATICAGSSTPLTASGTATTYTWVPATGLSATTGTNVTANPTVTTTYTITGTAGCSATAIVTVTVTPIPTMNSVADITKCMNATTGAINFSSSTSGVSYTWTNTTTSIGLAATGTGSIPSFTVANSITAPLTATVSVTPELNGCFGNPVAFKIISVPKPSNTVVLLHQTYCNGDLTNAVHFVANVPGSTYQWTNTNASVGIGTSGTGDIPAFTATNSGSSNIIGFFNAQPTFTYNGLTCVGNGAGWNVTVKPFIGGVSSTPSNTTVCAGTGANLTVTASGYDTYAWSPAAGLSATTGLSVTATPTTTRTYTFTASTTNGCNTTATVQVSVNPLPVLSTVADITKCNGAGITTTLNSTVAGTSYTWTNSNTAIGLAASGSGSGITAFTATNTTTVPISGTVTVTPSSNGCTGADKTFSITINPVPENEVALLDQSYCAGDATSVTIPYSSVSGAVFAWTNNNAAIGIGTSGSGNIPSFTTVNNGTSQISGLFAATPTFTNNGVTCTGSTVNWYVDVKPRPMLSAIPDRTVCAGAVTTAINPISSIPASYTWSNSTNIGLATTGAGSIPAFTATNSTTVIIHDTITVVPTATNGCAGIADVFVISVPPAPLMDAVVGQTVCNGASVTAINFSAAGTATFDWTNSNSSIGLASAGTGNIASFTAINTGSAIQTATVTVTPVIDGCTGAQEHLSIVVNPTPYVMPVSNQDVCNGTIVATVNYTGPVTGTTYTWTNTASSIGLATTGTGDIPSFTGTNTGSAPVTATVNVTPAANGCTGTAGSFTIKVNPTPNVAPVAGQARCNGVSTSAVLFSGTVGSTLYNWINSNSSIGLAGTGTGDILSFPIVNTGTAVQTATVTVTPSANGCIGAAITFVMTANPIPSVAIPADQDVCNGTSIAAVIYTGPVTGTTYTWTNTASSIGLATTGTGDIPSFTGTNTGSAPVTATVNVTPAANGCTGTAESFTIKVNPTPNVAPVASQARCNGVSTSAVLFSGTVGSTLYTWINSNSSIGLAGTGTGDIPSFPIVNTGTTVQTATVTATPSANGCTGAAITFVMTANPIPSVAIPADQDVCNGTSVTAVIYTGSVTGTTYTWTNTASSIGLATTGAGDIPSFTGTNTGSAPVTATVNVTPIANGCTGTAESFTINVDPTPVVITPVSQTLCNGTTVAAINFTGPVSGTVYTWSNSATSIGLASTGTGNIASFIGTNSTNAPVTASVSVTPAANGCTGSVETFIIEVNPTPAMTALTDQVICSGAKTSAVSFTGPVSGTTYHWTNSVTSIGLAASGSGDIAAFSATNSSASRVVATVNVTPMANGCNGTVRKFTFTVDPNPVAATIDTKPESLCANVQYMNFGTATSAATGVKYTWSANNATVDNVSSNGQYCLVSVPSAGTVSVTLTTEYAATGCSSIQSYSVVANNNAITAPDVIYYDKHFICLQNDVDGYVWGYDNALTLDSTVIAGENNQSYYNASPDLTGKYYWVLVTKNGCSQKAYFKIPTTGVENTLGGILNMNVYPNPTTDAINVVLTGLEYSNTTVKIYDMTGRQVVTSVMTDGKVAINLRHLKPGGYVIGCYIDGTRVSSATFIKQ